MAVNYPSIPFADTFFYSPARLRLTKSGKSGKFIWSGRVGAFLLMMSFILLDELLKTLFELSRFIKENKAFIHRIKQTLRSVISKKRVEALR